MHWIHTWSCLPGKRLAHAGSITISGKSKKTLCNRSPRGTRNEPRRHKGNRSLMKRRMRREGLQTQPFAFIPNSDGRHQENRPLTSSCLGDFVVQFSDATRGRPEPLRPYCAGSSGLMVLLLKYRDGSHASRELREKGTSFQVGFRHHLPQIDYSGYVL
jgi:hypothetical protein